jgi:hypothetical protein
VGIALVSPPEEKRLVNTTRPDADLIASARRAATGPYQPPAAGVAAVAPRELALLESAHDELMRQVRDLRRAYEAERRRRARLAESTYGLVTLLSGAAASTAYAARDGREPEAIGGA